MASCGFVGGLGVARSRRSILVSPPKFGSCSSDYGSEVHPENETRSSIAVIKEETKR